MDFAAFVAHLRQFVDLDSVAVTESTTLDELELDSLQLYELLIVVEELGAEVPEERFETFETVGDVYHHYHNCAGSISMPKPT